MGIAWSKEHYRVPKEECLSDIYGSDDSNLLDDVKVRYNKLIDAFKEQFSEPPQTIARSPGRVNLIGEHIDYEGYSVLPMAIGFAGGEADVPLARTIVGGVIAATLLPKFVVPCLYVLVKRRKDRTEDMDAAWA